MKTQTTQDKATAKTISEREDVLGEYVPAKTDKATARPWGVYHTQHGVQYVGNVETRKTACTVESGDNQAADVALICQAVNERAALVAVAEAAKELTSADNENIKRGLLANLKTSLANLAAIS